jgi:hypothetical protein
VPCGRSFALRGFLSVYRLDSSPPRVPRRARPSVFMPPRLCGSDGSRADAGVVWPHSACSGLEIAFGVQQNGFQNVGSPPQATTTCAPAAPTGGDTIDAAGRGGRAWAAPGGPAWLGSCAGGTIAPPFPCAPNAIPRRSRVYTANTEEARLPPDGARGVDFSWCIFGSISVVRPGTASGSRGWQNSPMRKRNRRDPRAQKFSKASQIVCATKI